MQKLLTEKTGLEKDIRILNEKLSTALSDCNAKDNIAKKQVKIAEEAISGDLLFNSILNIFSYPFSTARIREEILDFSASSFHSQLDLFV